MLDVVDASSDESAGKTGALSVQTVIDCYLFYAESTNHLKVEEKSILLNEYLRTSLNHNQLWAVLASQWCVLS
jgi:hypothetical protein